MKPHSTVLALALASAFSAGVLAQDALTESQIRAQLTAQGYTKIHDLDFKDGAWVANVTSADGNDVKVHVDAKTGKAFTGDVTSRLSEADVKAALATAGYTNVHDLKFKDGFWRAEADAPNGKSVEVKVDPGNGQVIGSEKD